MRRLNVVCVPVVGDPFCEVVEDDLSLYQDVVGGYIETIDVHRFLPLHERILPRAVIVCNEEGRLKDLPENCFGIVGTFLVVNTNTYGDTFMSLSPNEMKKVIQVIKKEKARLRKAKA